MSLRALYYLPVYWFSLLMFALGGLEVSALGLLCGWMPATDATERIFQRYIHYHLRFFHEWCSLAGLVKIRFHGLDRLPAGGVVLVANHVSLIDATCLMAHFTEMACIFKPAIRRNPVLGAAARRAGYLASDGGHDLVRRAAAKVAGGHQVLIFPEGTRAPEGQPLLPFKPGFALIARRAQAPVQLVRIATDSDLLRKGRSILWLPRCPAHFEITIGPLLASDGFARTEDLAAAAEAWYRGGPAVTPARTLAEPVPA